MRIALITILLCGAAHAKPLANMKGWDLYSWEDAACEPADSTEKPKVCYALTPGTNRLKTIAEVQKARIGYKQLDKQLAELAKGESIFWNNGGSLDGKFPLTLPAEPRRQQLRDTAMRLGLKLELPTTAAKNTCNPDELAALSTWLLSLAAVHDTIVPRDKRIALIARADAPQRVDIGQGGIATVSKDAITLNGKLIGNAAKPELAPLAKELAPPSTNTRPLHVMVASEASWSTVAVLSAAAAKAGYPSVAFLYAATPSVQKPGPSAIDKDLEANASSATLAMTTHPESLPAKLFKSCESVSTWLPTLSSLEPGVRTLRFSAELPALLQKCECNVDLPSVRAWAWEMIGAGSLNQYSGTTRVKLASDADKGAVAVELAGSSSWSTAMPKVIEAAKAGKPMRLVAR